VSTRRRQASHTLAEKIIADHLTDAGDSARSQGEVWPGELVEVAVDVVLANDVTAPIAISEFGRLGADKVFDRDRIVLVADHFVPNKDIKSAEQCRTMREFARAQELSHYYDVGRMGIEHVLLPEQGLVVSGDVVVGADSHTCTYGALGAFATGMGSTDIGVAMATGETWMKIPETIRIVYHGELRPWVGGKDLILFTIGKLGVSGALYKAIEFAGEAIDGLTMAGRLTMANMAIEAGAKVGLFTPDDETRAYLDSRAKRPAKYYEPDPGAGYAEVLEIDVSEVELQVSLPYSPDNVRAVSDVGDVPIDQAVIGSCTNGRLEDLRAAAEVLRGRRVHPDVRCIVIPGSQTVYLDALREGLVEVFVEAGAVVSTPTCGPCLGGYMGVLAAGERAVSTTNRNFRGRMGHKESEVYLSGPVIAACSAVKGRITGPYEVLL
jgi:3-isopropylmalate/(R)-2-methylmalate dehydratase large subunit